MAYTLTKKFGQTGKCTSSCYGELRKPTPFHTNKTIFQRRLRCFTSKEINAETRHYYYGELWIDWKNPNLPGDNTPFRFTGKEMDQETGLYYYGARYLDPKTSRWLSSDPAMGEYVPSAPVNDEAKKRNGNLPGQGGVYNYVNLHVYHYAGNNPVKYVDPDGNTIRPLENDEWETVKRVRDETVQYLDTMINEINQYTSGNSQGLSNNIQKNAKDWLGININDKETASVLAKDLTKIRDNLASKERSDFRINEKMKDFASVNRDAPFINLGTCFFYQAIDIAKSKTNIDTKHSILVHETTHFRSVLNTRDGFNTTNGYARSLANNPSRARKNPVNWEMFFYYSVTRR